MDLIKPLDDLLTKSKVSFLFKRMMKIEFQEFLAVKHHIDKELEYEPTGTIQLIIWKKV